MASDEKQSWNVGFTFFYISCTTEIIFGIKSDVDVLVYAKTEFNEYQMREIRLGLEDNLDVSIYAKSEFDYLQMD